jgi:hypothetical protein
MPHNDLWSHPGYFCKQNKMFHVKHLKNNRGGQYMNKKVDAVIMGYLIVLMMLGHILRLYDVEISIYLILLGGALYCAAFAFINLSGHELFIDKKYRGMDAAKRWQRETVLPALLSSAGCIAFGVLTWFDNAAEFTGFWDFWMGYLIWALFMAGMIIWMIVVNAIFFKVMDEKDRPWLMRL